MPELPEVETIRSDLEKKIKGLKFTGVEIRLPKIIKSGASKLLTELKNKEILSVNRKGKLIYFTLSDELFLIVHLRMTGQLIYKNKKQIIAGGHSDTLEQVQVPNKHTHVILELSDDSKIYYNDLRQFGVIKTANKNELEKELKKYGTDPILEKFPLDEFEKILGNRSTRNIKAFLLDQKKVSGLGNIYVDEVLFLSRVLPERTVQSLKKSEIKLIHEHIVKVLKLAIKERGTTFNNYSDADGNKGNFLKHLKVYQRAGKECLVCKNEIYKIKLAGRGTHFCKKCQK